jgi:hypothetical protein
MKDQITNNEPCYWSGSPAYLGAQTKEKIQRCKTVDSLEDRTPIKVILAQVETVLFDQIASTVRQIPDIPTRHDVARKLGMALKNAGFIYDPEKWLIKCDLRPEKNEEK